MNDYTLMDQICVIMERLTDLERKLDKRIDKCEDRLDKLDKPARIVPLRISGKRM